MAYSPKCLEKLSTKSLSSVSSAEIAVISQRNEPSVLCFVGFDAFVLRLARLFRQFLEGEFSEVGHTQRAKDHSFLGPCALRASLLPLFTGVRGRGILRS